LTLRDIRMKSPTTRKEAADVSGTHLWLVLMKAHQALERLATQSIESFEVGLSDFGIMELLLHKGPQPVNEIGRRIALTSGAITTAVDRLEAQGLVTREAHQSDRRARIVRLTRRGEEQAVRIFAGHKTAMDLAASGLSKADRAILIRLLEKFGTSAGDSAAPQQLEVSHVGTSVSATRPRN
jgi:MarR family transcriptional regulator, 2-MHQ and catechol-resistance regulon repressor